MPTTTSDSKKSSDILKAIIAIVVFGVILLLSARVAKEAVPQNNDISSLVESGEYYYELGKMYDYAGERELAYVNLKKAESLLSPRDKHLLAVYVLLSRLLLPVDKPLDESKKQEIENYISILTDPQNTNTEQSWGYSVLSELRRMENKKNDAINFGKKAVILDPKNAAAQHVYGMAMFGGSENGKRVFYTDRLDEVISALTKSVEIQRTMSPSWYLLGVAYWYKGDKDKANQMWQKSSLLLPDDPYYPAWFKSNLKQKVDNALNNPEELDEMRR